MKGYSIHIGVNEVNSEHYTDLDNLLSAVNDAVDMKSLAIDDYGYINIDIFLDKKATSVNVLSAFSKARELCKSGDILLVTYSGHGSYIENLKVKGDSEEEDQTWCLYDRQFIDDEIFYEISKFDEEVRVLVVSDCCHSGTITKDIPQRGEPKKPIIEELGMSLIEFQEIYNLRSKKLPKEKSIEVYKANKNLYDQIQKSMPKLPDKNSIKASVVSLSACLDDQVTFDGSPNGIFTKVLKEILSLPHEVFFDSPDGIIEKVKEYYEFPTPKFYAYGRNEIFIEKGNPFCIIPQSKTKDSISKTIKDKKELGRINSSNMKISNKIVIKNNNGDLDLQSIDAICVARVLSVNFEIIDKTTCTLRIESDDNIWNEVHKIAKKSDDLKLDIVIHPDGFTNEVNFNIVREKSGVDFITNNQLGQSESRSLAKEFYNVLYQLNLEDLNKIIDRNKLTENDYNIILKYKDDIVSYGVSERLESIVFL